MVHPALLQLVVFLYIASHLWADLLGTPKPSVHQIRLDSQSPSHGRLIAFVALSTELLQVFPASGIDILHP